MDSPDRPNIYRRLAGYLRPYRGRFALAVLAMVVYGTTDGVVPLLIRSILDDIFGSKDRNMLQLLPMVLVVFALVRGVFGFFQRYLAAQVGLNIIRDIRNEISWHLLSLSSSFFSRHSTGTLIARMTNDTLLVKTALTDAASALLRDSIRVIALISVAIYLDPTLAAFSFLGLPLALIPIIKFGKKIRRLSRVGQDQFGGLTAVLQETIVGQQVIRAFSQEKHEQQKFVEENQHLTQTFKKAEKYGALSGPTNEVIASFIIAGVILYGGHSVIEGTRTQGDFVAFLMSVFLLYEPVKKLSRVNNVIQTAAGAAERIFEVLDEKPEIADTPDAEPLATSEINVEFRNVWFRYQSQVEGSQWALRDINLSIPNGQSLALVGMSGGGKSSLVQLIPRFYEPQQGQVLINGQNIRKFQLHSLRRHVGLVSQHTFLFNDSVANNIGYGRLGASRSDIEAAARAANADRFIRELPEGYDTEIGEQGLRLSGGERARIAIARALLSESPLLILDEATAALDSESEYLVQQAIDRLITNRTVVMIAHRLATVKKADKIAVLVNGQIVEYGTHDELLGKGGEFSKLYNLQFKDQADSEVSVDQTLRVGAQS